MPPADRHTDWKERGAEMFNARNVGLVLGMLVAVGLTVAAIIASTSIG